MAKGHVRMMRYRRYGRRPTGIYRVNYWFPDRAYCRCGSCDDPILPGRRVTLFKGLPWHVSCVRQRLYEGGYEVHQHKHLERQFWMFNADLLRRYGQLEIDLQAICNSHQQPYGECAGCDPEAYARVLTSTRTDRVCEICEQPVALGARIAKTGFKRWGHWACKFPN